MLHALGFPDSAMPQLLVHGWWNISGAKMSKSAGNIVDPSALADKYGAEALRYYLMSDIATGKDADFSEERLITRYDSDLANSLGNLLNRTLNMALQYCRSSVRTSREESDVQVPLAKAAETALGDYRIMIETGSRKTGETEFYNWEPYRIQDALAAVNTFVIACNQFIDDKKPWFLVKERSKHERVEAILHGLSESLRIIAILISPMLPRAAHEIFDQLNWKIELTGKEERLHLDDAKWGGLPDGHLVGKPVPLFPRIET
jgi:methionyl-tRNA synthetase